MKVQKLKSTCQQLLFLNFIGARKKEILPFCHRGEKRKGEESLLLLDVALHCGNVSAAVQFFFLASHFSYLRHLFIVIDISNYQTFSAHFIFIKD